MTTQTNANPNNNYEDENAQKFNFAFVRETIIMLIKIGMFIAVCIFLRQFLFEVNDIYMFFNGAVEEVLKSEITPTFILLIFAFLVSYNMNK